MVRIPEEGEKEESQKKSEKCLNVAGSFVITSCRVTATRLLVVRGLAGKDGKIKISRARTGVRIGETLIVRMNDDVAFTAVH